MFFLTLLCLSGRPHRVTLISKKIYLSPSVSVRLPTPCDTHFQNTKKPKIVFFIF